MRNSWLKKLIPHAVAVAIFLVVAVIYCRPALEGKVVKQHDITHWTGAIQQSKEYKETHGEYPLWTNSLFSGMPTFQIGTPGNNVLPWIIHNIITLGLPKPINFFFLACICFYFLCCVVGIRPAVGIVGSLAFAYVTYNAVIIAVGHDTKMLSISYMPALLGSVLFIYEKRYWLGAGLTALFTSVMIAMNHPQIDYYFFIVVGIMTISYIIRWTRNRETAHLVRSLSFTLIAAVIGVLTNAVTLLSTYEYQKETIRGGSSEVLVDSSQNVSKTGLDKSYAFSYSLGVAETFVMVVPRMYGGSSDHKQIDEEKSKAVDVVRNMQPQAQQFIFQNFPFFAQTEEGELYVRSYWGGIGGTSGPPYVGAVIIFLSIIGFFVLDGKHKWWILATIVLTVMMSWGSYFDSFNSLLYKYLPLYNKFRAPSMILVVSQFLVPFLGALGLNAIINSTDRDALFKKLKRGGIATLVLFLVLLMIYFSAAFVTDDVKELLRDPRLVQQAEAHDIVKQVVDGIKEDRRSLMMNDIMRSFGFMAASAVLIFLFYRRVIKSLFLCIALGLLVLIDLFPINSIYLNEDNYKDDIENTESFVKTPSDQAILADTAYYRVYNVSQGAVVDGDRFSENITSYYYNSLGGYHPAKLKIYHDLIERHLRRGMPENILDMLNTKYLVQKSAVGQTTAYQQRATALGPVWFVKAIRYVKDAREEINALDNFNPADTAIVQQSFKSSIPFEPQFDSSATIRLIKNDNDVINYTSASATNQFAVFSEIYYASGWKAFIDGKEAPIVKVNYVLRGLAVPAGNHNIEFRFEPRGYYRGRMITSIFTILLLLVVAVGIFMEWRKTRQAGLANRA